MESSSWVRVQACTLPSADVPLRVTEFADLFAHLHDLARADITWLRLRLNGGDTVEQQARDLTAKESRCCSFFDFTVGRDPDGLVVVDVHVPSNRADVLDGLARQAEAGRAVR